ncbi:helix-turn-helix domain-containing protein [Salmonella enterica]|nr:DNA-binding protein [Salmonella enterica]EBR1113912.1 helix-turn-helix domain-containing protein [Salmonella enterica]
MRLSTAIELKRFSRREAAAYIGVTSQTLANWAHTGKEQIPFHKSGRKVVYHKADLDAYIDSTRRTQTK